MKPSLVLSFVLPSLVSGTPYPQPTASYPVGGIAFPEGVSPGKSANLTIASKSGVTPRRYRLHVPANYDDHKKAPLILSFHGRGKDAKFQEALSQFSNASYGFDGIAVYPEGVAVRIRHSSSEQRHLLIGAQTRKGTQQFQGDPDAPASVNDVTFVLELLDHLETTFNIDTSRIYAAGKSNGGGFTGLLACDPEATKRIAAFAPVSGAFYLTQNQTLPACTPSRTPIPILEFHGWKDTTIPYLGGINTRGNANSTNIVTFEADGSADFGNDAG